MQLKTTPEDFIVEELLTPIFDETGAYSVYTLHKRDWNTEDVLQWLARALHRPRGDFGVCGNKDKKAITTQYITIKHGPKDLRGPSDVTITYLGRVKEPLRLGVHGANRFTIVIRDVPAALEGQTLAQKRTINYFGEQRFSEKNAEIGLLLLKKDYRAAASALGLEFTTDPIGALKRVPKHTLLLYVHAAQALLWNERAYTLVREGNETPVMFELPGYGIDLTPYAALLTKHGLDESSFINRSISDLSVEGVERKLFQNVQDFSATPITDNTCTLRFTLGRGEYATEAVRQLFSDDAVPPPLSHTP